MKSPRRRERPTPAEVARALAAAAPLPAKAPPERPRSCPDCGGGPLAIQDSIMGEGEELAVCLGCHAEFVARSRP